MKTVIALTGVKFSGKTTAFEYIRSLRPDVIEITLAGKLKDVCATVFDIPRDYFDRPDVKEKEMDTLVELETENLQAIFEHFDGYEIVFDKHIRPHIGKVLHTPRQVAQYVGTEVLRTVDPDVHCRHATRGKPQDGIFVVTDMRFPNEFDFFAVDKTCQFHPFYIKNTGAECKAGDDPHPSESHIKDLAKRCTTIDNDSTVQEFYKRIQKRVGPLL